MIFKGAYCAFRCVTLMCVRGYQLVVNVFIGEIFFEGLGCLVVQNEGLWFEASDGEVFNNGLECCFEFTAVVCLEWSNEDGITVVVIDDHEILKPFC